MDSRDRVVEIDQLEQSLLPNGEESILYTASFAEEEDNFVKYQTAWWISYSLLLMLAWGIGLLMLLYLPVRRYILRKDIRSRKLYITPTAIVYKVRRPVAFPCFGVLKREKHVVLSSVANIVIEQGYMQSKFGVYSIRIENVGVRRPPGDDVQIQGIANPHAFRKAVLMHLSKMRSEVLTLEASVAEDGPSARIGHSTVASMSPSKSFKFGAPSHIGEQVILQRLEEVGSSIKRLQTLIEEQQQPQTPEYRD